MNNGMNNNQNNNFNNMNNNQNNFNNMNNMPNNNFNNMNGNNPNQFTQAFTDETTKNKEKMCEIAFWVSIVGVLISLTGVAFGLLVYVVEFYLAIQGLNTRKRWKAIAAIALSIISIIIIIVKIIQVMNK